jgi:drug/metabolite transporter (DMT)-like permease
MPIANASAILQSLPLVVTFGAALFFKEPVGWRRWLAILVGFAGVLVIVRPGTAAFHPAIFVSLVGVVFTAFYMLLTRKLAGVDAVTTQQFYSGLVATICVAGFAIGGWQWPADAAGWVCFGLIGVAALAGHQLLTTAHRFAPASVLAPFGYLQIIFMTASSWLIFQQPPDVWIFVGAPIVIGSGLYIWLRERQLSRSVVTAVAGED